MQASLLLLSLLHRLIALAAPIVDRFVRYYAALPISYSLSGAMSAPFFQSDKKGSYSIAGLQIFTLTAGEYLRPFGSKRPEVER